ncbi:MAG: T9SS type A sorting domain-containing protein, partial [Bacteroidota bacterium]
RAEGDEGRSLEISFDLINEVEAGEAIVRLLEVNTATESVSIKNFGTDTQDLSTFQFCLGPGQYNALNNYTNLSGDLSLEPNEELTIDLTSGSQNVQALPDANGSLLLFSNPNFGSNSADDILDFIQWGAPNGNRVSQAVNAGRWTSANEFVAGATPFNYVGDADDLGPNFWIDNTNIRMIQIIPESDEVLLQNFDNVSRDLSNYFFCTQPGVYPQLGNTNQVEILAGDLNLAPGEEVRVKVLTAGGVITDNGSIFLFSSNVLGFNNQNPFVTRDFAQWDAPNGFRVENAVAAGRWDAVSSFIAGNDPFSYIGGAEDIGADFWEASQVGEAIIRMLQVNTATESVTLKNFGSASQDISDYQFCLGPGQYNILSNYTSVSGDLNLAPNEEVTFDLTSGSLNVQALPDAYGSLLLFANSNFGSNSGEDIKDAIQWGAANGNRVSQAVNAGRWTSANDFVAGETPFNYVGGANDIGPNFWEATLAGEAVIRMIKVNTATESVTLKNFGGASQDVSDYQFCLGPGQYNILSNYTNINGDLNLAPNEEVTFDLTSGSLNVQALPDADGSLLLFANTSFGSDSPDDIKDAIQWGAANGNRVAQAVLAGRWTNTSEFVAGETPFIYVGGANDIGPNFWNASTSLSVFPNPSNGQLNVEGQAGDAYEVRDAQGNIIQEGQLKSAPTRLQLAEGIYFISNGKETKRVIIK